MRLQRCFLYHVVGILRGVLPHREEARRADSGQSTAASPPRGALAALGGTSPSEPPPALTASTHIHADPTSGLSIPASQFLHPVTPLMRWDAVSEGLSGVHAGHCLRLARGKTMWRAATTRPTSATSATCLGTGRAIARENPLTGRYAQCFFIVSSIPCCCSLKMVSHAESSRA